MNAAQIGTRCGNKKTDALTYSILSDNWYVIVLPPVEEENRRAIRNERAKDAAHRSVCFWGRGRPGRGVTPSSEATARYGDEAQTALHVRRGLPATDWNRRKAPVADRGPGRLSWVDSARPRVVSGRTGVLSETRHSRARPNGLHSPKQTYANCANSDTASVISGISGVGEKPSSAGARTAWAPAARPVDW